MPNTFSVDISITRADIEAILSDQSVTHIRVTGDINITSADTSTWGIEAYGYSYTEQANTAGTGKSTCPHPC